ncbi:MAG: thioredoxin domain-containing protein [Chlamydiales bacterium]
MTSEKIAPRRLILITLTLLLVISGGAALANRSTLPKAIPLDWEGQPTIGYTKAKVHVVVFEEPKCGNCREYNQKIFPKIKSNFIDTNKITYTVIPVSFLPGSMPAATALMCVYNAEPMYPNSELFFTYLDYLYNNQPIEKRDWATPDTLVEMAGKASPAIQLEKLKNCIEMQSYRIRIEKNTAYGKQVMGGVISTPTFFVNGMEVKELTFDKASTMIKQVMASVGVK